MSGRGEGTPQLRLGCAPAEMALAHARVPGQGQVAVALRLMNTPVEALQAALEALACHHPMLRCTLVEEAECLLHLAPESARPLALEAEPAEADGAWVQAFEQALETPLQPWESLWRARLLVGQEQLDLILTLHHVACDGVSVTQLALDLAALCVDPERLAGRPTPPLVYDIGPRLVAPWSFAAATRWIRLSWAFEHPRPQAWPYTVAAPLRERRQRLLCVQLPLTQLHARYPKEQRGAVTLNELMVTALGRALGEAGACAGRVLLLVPVSLRGALQPPLPPEHLGLAVSTYTLGLPTGGRGPLLAQARGVGRRMRRARRQRALPIRAIPPAITEDWACAYYDPDIPSFQSGVALTNSGAWPAAPGGRLQHLYVNSCRLAGDTALALSVRSVGARLFACLGFVEPLLEAELAEAALSRWVALLTDPELAG